MPKLYVVHLSEHQRGQLHEEPDDPKRPRICFDERPRQLLGGSRESFPIGPAYAACFDCEYTRHGTCNLFIMAEPFQGWRHLRV
jgi:hypothetical protein